MAAGTNSAASKRSNRIFPPFAWLGASRPRRSRGTVSAQSIDQFAEPAPRTKRNASTDVFTRLRIGVDGASRRELQFAARETRVHTSIEVLAETRALQADAECPAFKVRFPRGRFFGKTGKTDL